MERFVLQAEVSELVNYFNITERNELTFGRHYNIKPRTRLPIVLQKQNLRQLAQADWGIDFGPDTFISALPYTQAQEEAQFKNMVQNQPCIIPASGFYKWKKTSGADKPFYLRLLNSDIIGIAGFYNITGRPDGSNAITFTALTMPANALIEPLDTSMPYILKKSHFDGWLKGEAPNILQHTPDGNELLPYMAVYRVPELVNNAELNSPELIQPVTKPKSEDDED